jgi:hypothetical protein
MLVDADRYMIDFERDRFQFSDEAWEEYSKGNIDTGKYISSGWKGSRAIFHILLQDLSSVINEDKATYDEANLMRDAAFDASLIDAATIAVLGEAARLLRDPDANLQRLVELHNENGLLQASGMTLDDWVESLRARGDGP